MDASAPTHPTQTYCLVSRNSGQQGSKARKHVAAECHRTADDLYRHTGIDVRAAIPPQAELVHMLKTRASRKQSTDSSTGKTFVNEFLRVHCARNVVLLLSTGSGRKIDADLGQPFLDWLNGELKATKPDKLVFHRHDRVFRTRLLPANTLHLCHELGIQMIDGEKGVLEGDLQDILAMLRARESDEEASRIPTKTRNGQISRTDTDMSTGSVRYAVAQAPPAGMMVVRMKAPNGQAGEGRLFFDTPADYPDLSEVAYGLPEVFADGERVDQVANVRFALSRLGRPNWTINAVGRALVARGFSTHRLRMSNTARTAFSPELVDGAFERVLRPILDRLEFYRTGALPVRFGIHGIDDIEIVNCFPLDGRSWASEEDFRRIEAYLSSTKGGGPARQGLTGITVQTEGGALHLRAAPAQRATAGPSYLLRPAEEGKPATLHLPALPHAVLAASLVEGLVAHADELLIPLLEQDLPEVETTRRELRAAEEQVETIHQRRRAMLDALQRTDAEGNPVISGYAHQDLSEDYNALIENELHPAQAEVHRLTGELEQLTQRAVANDPAVRAELLLRMVDCLRDPYDTTYNDLWKGAVRIEHISRTPVRLHDTAGACIRWRGTIRIAGADHEFSAPFHGEYLHGAAAQLPGKVDAVLEQLLHGTPFAAIEQTNARGVRLALAERLGFDSRFFGLPTCSVPRLVRIAAHLAIDADRDIARVAESLGEAPSLVET